MQTRQCNMLKTESRICVVKEQLCLPVHEEVAWLECMKRISGRPESIYRHVSLYVTCSVTEYRCTW